jgi:hypothetical protein
VGNIPHAEVLEYEVIKRSENKCKHCGKPCSEKEGIVCDKCYSKYTAGMLADLEG